MQYYVIIIIIIIIMIASTISTKIALNIVITDLFLEWLHSSSWKIENLSRLSFIT